MLSEKVSICLFLGHCHISTAELYTSSSENDVENFCSAVSKIVLNEGRATHFETKEE